MVMVFYTHFGKWANGTVATQYLKPGIRRHSMGISMLILMASILESRMKGRVGISDADKGGYPNEQQQQQPEQLLALHKKILLQKVTFLMR
jgi:hypothetical protein